MRPLLALVLAFAVAGCGGHTTVTVTVTKRPPPPPQAQQETFCEVTAYGHAVEVDFDGTGAAAACAEFIRKFSAAGDYWQHGASTARETTAVCQLARGLLTVTVLDVAYGTMGPRICADFAHAGWTDQ